MAVHEQNLKHLSKVVSYLQLDEVTIMFENCVEDALLEQVTTMFGNAMVMMAVKT